MNIWNLRSAIIIWIFAWGWLQAFDYQAPIRERWSIEHREEQVLSIERAARQAESDAADAAEFTEMCASETARVEELCNPPEEPWFFESWFVNAELAEAAQEIADLID